MPYLFTQILLCLLLAFLLGVLVGWLLKRWYCKRDMDRLREEMSGGAELADLRVRLEKCEKANSRAAATTSDTAKMAAAASALSAIPAARRKDDLKRIWGIGPKMEELLNNVGIESFEQVAGASVDRLRDILVAYGTKRLTDIANEETWPEQAGMAARGDWDALKTYQENLSWKSGGRPS